MSTSASEQIVGFLILHFRQKKGGSVFLRSSVNQVIQVMQVIKVSDTNDTNNTRNTRITIAFCKTI